MPTTNPIKARIRKLKGEYDVLREGKASLLKIITEAELSESVFNSNAIENSTLTLRETERILLDLEVARNVSVREVFEAKNLARVMEYMETKSRDTELSEGLILLLHRMLLTGINDAIAGRFRSAGEYVRVGTHIAVPPEHIGRKMEELLLQYSGDHETYFSDQIARFHLGFETIHPFNDGNGRIGRVLINYQLLRLGFPPVIIRDKEKQTYYESFRAYQDKRDVKGMEKIIALSILESLHKRVAYLKGSTIIPLSDYARRVGKSGATVVNAARRQTIPAFREKGVWKIGEEG